MADLPRPLRLQSVSRAESIRIRRLSPSTQEVTHEYYGFYIEETGQFVRNSAINNAGPGAVIIDEAAEFPPIPPQPYPVFFTNNFFGRHRRSRRVGSVPSTGTRRVQRTATRRRQPQR